MTLLGATGTLLACLVVLIVSGELSKEDWEQVRRLFGRRGASRT
jgi:hypothetical protein